MITVRERHRGGVGKGKGGKQVREGKMKREEREQKEEGRVSACPKKSAKLNGN